jgi:nitroreductase
MSLLPSVFNPFSRYCMNYPHNLAVTALPVLDIIKERWSPRAMSPQTIEPEKIETLFEAARWAPSSSNLQPWRYYYATKDDGEARLKLESLLEPGNNWAKNAYLLIISFADTKRTRKDGTQGDNYHALHDTGAASAFLALQCEPLGLVGHQMAGFDREKANGLLGVPENFVPGSMIAVAYPDALESLSPELQEKEKRPRERKQQREFVFRVAA